MEFLIIGISVFLNIAILKWKFDHTRYLDAFVDTFLLAGVMFLFSGSYGALVVGTVASLLVSLYLLISPPKLPSL